MPAESIHPAVRVGHIDLRVADLARAITFYRDVLGFELTAQWCEAGSAGAFLAAGDYHHHIGLNTWETASASPPPSELEALCRVAFLYPDRRELGHAVTRVLDHGYPIDRGCDHGATVSVYLTDPDGNTIELYYDRPRARWFDAHGHPIRSAERFDPIELLHGAR